MPPKAKFTKEEIAAAAFAIVREAGTEALTARTLGKRLGSSACPIFTVFGSMEEVQAEVLKSAKALYAAYVREGLRQMPAFKGVGMQYILFAKNEPNLFQLLFMTEKNTEDVNRLLPAIDDNYDLILQAVKDYYALDEEDAKRLYLHLGIYSHGIAALFAKRVCAFSEKEVGELLTEVFSGLIKEIGRGKTL